MKECVTCKRELDQEDDESTMDCGGECVYCMAEAGDPDCIDHMSNIEPFNDHWKEIRKLGY